MSARYAIYYAPDPDSLLFSLGIAWHGRDPWSGKLLPPPAAVGERASEWDRLVASPQHYGFHATLKAPFALRTGTDEAMLNSALSEFARATTSFLVPPLIVSGIGPFLALTLPARHPDMEILAASAVETFDPFRAPEGVADIVRRREAGLTNRQDALLARWGYPYVFEEFRFHMTLTSALPREDALALRSRLVDHFRPVSALPLLIDRVALFHQESRKTPFRILRYFPFGGG